MENTKKSLIKNSYKVIHDDFPVDIRPSIIHIIDDLMDRGYLCKWQNILREFRRLARSENIYEEFENDIQIKSDALGMLKQLSWEKVCVLCERIATKLQSVDDYDSYGRFIDTIVTLDEAKTYYENEINQLLQEENIALEFKKGVFYRSGNLHTQEVSSKLERKVINKNLDKAREHYRKAKLFFENIEKPDYESTINSCSLSFEAAIKHLFPDVKKSNFSDILKTITGSEEGKIPSSITTCIEKLYAFRGACDGVAHAGTNGGKATKEIAEFYLSVTASIIIFLDDFRRSIENAEIELPF